MKYNIYNNICSRIYNHAELGLSTDVQLEQASDYKHQSNLIEKTGNGVLWTLSLLPRSVKWVGRQFQDPRIVTIALTLSALTAVSFAFYPATTFAACSFVFTGVKLLASQIPLWGVKFSAYLIICSTITGYGTRAVGRFSNEALMKAFYGLPKDYQGNPANMTIDEIREAVNKSKLTTIVSDKAKAA